jgi:hypothetical protein
MSHSIHFFICEDFGTKNEKIYKHVLHITLKSLFNVPCSKNNRFVLLKFIGILNKQAKFFEKKKKSFFNLLERKIYEHLKVLKVIIITIVRWSEIMSKLEQMLLSIFTMTFVPSCLLLTAALTKGQNNIQIDNNTYIVHACQAEKTGWCYKQTCLWLAQMFSVFCKNVCCCVSKPVE